MKVQPRPTVRLLFGAGGRVLEIDHAPISLDDMTPTERESMYEAFTPWWLSGFHGPLKSYLEQ